MSRNAGREDHDMCPCRVSVAVGRCGWRRCTPGCDVGEPPVHAGGVRRTEPRVERLLEREGESSMVASNLVLVPGGGGVGRDVLDQLLAWDLPVRALVRRD